MAPKLAVTGLRKRFGAKVVLDGVDLVVPPGRSLVVIGGSGTGKSVTLKCVLGLLGPDGGRIEIDGEDLATVTPARRRELRAQIGMLFQGAALFDSLRIWENVAFRLIQADGVDRRTARTRALDAMARVNLGADVADLRPAELSGGMQKRAALARAIVARPSLLFFDEPTTGLDPITAEVINELIVHTVKDLGASAVSITHDMTSARRIADDIAMLYQGRIIWTGPAAQIDDSGNAFVDQFVTGRADGPISIEGRRRD